MAVQVQTADERQDRIAQVLQPLVGVEPGVGMFVQIRAVGERLAQQLRILEGDADGTLERVEVPRV